LERVDGYLVNRAENSVDNEKQWIIQNSEVPTIHAAFDPENYFRHLNLLIAKQWHKYLLSRRKGPLFISSGPVGEKKS
jgi:hypothetical protein